MCEHPCVNEGVEQQYQSNDFKQYAADDFNNTIQPAVYTKVVYYKSALSPEFATKLGKGANNCKGTAVQG